ncbi:unnamed protein product [Schistosoma rodhaini]|nr:unnamed protein product [Schistosoma rodhaini]
MGIFLLNRLIDFLSPKIVPETSTDEVLPTKSSEEFRPFLRKLPELKFCDVLRLAVLRDYETSNIAYDQIPLFTIYLWETTSSVQWNEILKWIQLIHIYNM